MANERNVQGMNVLLFITDQERAMQHFPQGWASRNLPGEMRLRRHGLTFERAFCNSCMCSPSRASMMTGYFPAQHGVKWTLEDDMPAAKYPQAEMPSHLPNLATVMAAAGYSTPYKGKFHLTKPAGSTYAPADVGKYGFTRWNPQDAGGDQSPEQFGGGDANHDWRYIYDNGPVDQGKEGVLAYLNSDEPATAPFFLVVSLVNPHDVLAYPRTAFDNGYDEYWLDGEIELPETVNEDLSTKPAVQRQLISLANLGLGRMNKRQQRNYINFYANLIKSSDNYLVEVLDTLEARGLLDNTLIIRTSDHGEMGMAHGGMRQKNFNFYEESLRVPLIFSNPKLYPEPETSQAMVSHVDLLPTLANLFDAPQSARADWQGVDYSEVVLDPKTEASQDHIVFTFDDYQSGQKSGPYPGPLNHIISLREERYKLAKYYDANCPDGPWEWEMYDLQADPFEKTNLAHCDHRRTEEQEQEYQRLRRRLEAVERERLQPMALSQVAG